MKNGQISGTKIDLAIEEFRRRISTAENGVGSGWHRLAVKLDKGYVKVVQLEMNEQYGVDDQNYNR